MSIIERIKAMRGSNREGSEALNKRREDTIKQIQLQQIAEERVISKQ